MNRVLFGITLFFYFLATFHYILFLINQREGIGKVAQVSTIVAFTLHTLLLFHQGFSTGHVPMTSIRESLVFFAWAIVLIFVVLEYRFRLVVMGTFIIPLAFCGMVASLLFPVDTGPLPEYFSSGWLGVHTTLAFLADASFAIAFGVGLMYLIQHRQLKHKNPGALYRRLPSIDVLDELEYKAIAIGFPLLTLAMLTGSIWANSAWGEFWGWEPKEIWSLVTWLIYAVYLHARLVTGWRGKKAAYLAVIGFFIVMFTFLGVNLLLPGKHAFE